jgi:uncharacterized protein YdhG (YjbR/CyaY superfamily)
MKGRVANAVDEYIAPQPEALRPKLEQVRAVPRSGERFRKQRKVSDTVCPGYKLNGRPLLYFAGFKQHYSLFAASATFFASLQQELKSYEQRKGTIHFPLDAPGPVRLISRIAKLRASGISAMTARGAVRQKRTRQSSQKKQRT